MPRRDSFLLPITAFQTLVKRVGGSNSGEPTSLSSTSIGSLVFLSSSLSTLSADVGSTGVTGDSGNGDSDGDGDSNSNGDGNGNGTGIIFCLFFAIFTFLFAFFLGGCKIAELGAD